MTSESPSPLDRRRKDFRLSKWYLDCVSPDGQTFIGYSARLGWRGFSLLYSSILTYDQHHGVRTGTTLLKARPPVQDGDLIRWDVPGLRVSGSWKTMSPPVEDVLFEDASGKVLWSCYQPGSSAEVILEEGRHLKGLGYVECLEMTVEPWNLSLEELRWGRFVSETDSVVWIGLSGPRVSTRVFLNSTEVRGSVITDSEVILGDRGSRLTLSERSVLRDGALMAGPLSMIPGVTRILPEEILNAKETKWRSCGTFRQPRGPSVTGWAIHELVRFA